MYEDLTPTDTAPRNEEEIIEINGADQIEEALKILDERKWTRVDEFLNPWGEQWLTLAHLAAYRGNLDALKLATDLEAVDKLGRCALHYAADQGHFDVVKWLLACSATKRGPTSVEYIPPTLQKKKKLDRKWLLARLRGILAPKRHILRPIRPQYWAYPQLWLEDSMGMTALHLAVRAKHVDVVKALMREHMAEAATIPEDSDNTRVERFLEAWDVLPIHLAAHSGNLEVLENAPYLFDTDKLGRSPLHYAAEKGEINVVKYVLESFARYNPELLRNNSDSTPLSWTDDERMIRRSMDMIIPIVLREVFLQDSLGMTALHYAAEQGHANVVQHLVEHLMLIARRQAGLPSFKLSLPDSNDRTALQLAERANHADVVKILARAYFEDAVQILHENSISNRHISFGNYYVEEIHLAAYSGNLEALKRSRDLHARDKLGRHALHYAAEQNHVCVVKWLLEQPEEKSSQLTLEDSDGMTALHLAVKSRHVEVVKILLDAGADVNASDDRKLPPIFLAHYVFDRRILGREELPRYEAIVDILLRAKASVLDHHPTEGLTVLHYAVLLNSQKATQLFCEYDKRLILRRAKGLGAIAPLHIAAKYGFREVLDIMLKFVPSSWVDITNGGQRTSLHLAAIEGHLDCVRSLVDKGADLATKEENGCTAVSFLCRHKKYLKLGTFFTEILDANVQINERRIDVPLSKQVDDIDINFKVFTPEKRTRQFYDEDVSHMAMVSGLIEVLGREDQALIIQHPLIKAYNATKWSHVSWIFHSLVIFQFLLAVDISFYIIYMQKDSVASILRKMLFIFAGIPFCFRILQILAEPNCYFRKIENWLHIFCLMASIAVSLSGGFIADPTTSWIRYFLSVAIPLIWIQTMLSLGQIAGWTFYVLIFSSVLKDFLKVFVTSLLVIVGFAISSMVLFNDNEGYGDLSRNHLTNWNEESYLAAISKAVFFMLPILTGIILMNMILGLAINDIRSLVAEGEFGRLLKQAEFIIDCERMAGSHILQRCRLHEYLNSNIPTSMKFKRTERPPGFSQDLVNELFNLAFRNKNRQKESPVANESLISALQSSLTAIQSVLEKIVVEQELQKSQISNIHHK